MPDEIIQFILVPSIALQFLAAGYALRLIPLTRRKTAWILISSALILMGTRRIIGIFGLGEKLGSYIFLMEVVALIISILMVVGVFKIRSLFQELNDSLHRLQQFHRILENTPDFVGTWDHEGRFLYLNKSARRMARLQAGGLPADLKIDSIFLPESLQEVRARALPHARETGSWHGTTLLHAPGSSERSVFSQVVIAQPAETKPEGFLYSTIGRDITKRIEFENQLEELSQSRQRLLTVLAHDLRGPVGNAIALIQLLRDGLPHASKEETEALLGKSQESMENIYSMMERLLEWARSRTGQLEVDRQSCNLGDLVQPVIRELDPEINHKGIHLLVEIPPFLKIETDPVICSTILRNVTANAIKFSPTDGDVIVRAEPAGAVVTLSVQDSGPGISGVVLEKIRQGFPVESATGSKGEKGNGLGLSLCHSLMETLRNAWPGCALTIPESDSTGTIIILTFPNSEPPLPSGSAKPLHPQ